ncbi:MAG: pentapeptide repeat-containing protein [Chloroflexi bacterium]|nr:pentapeptide repeat-containing protein [Chloroflexota bacterium]
MEKADVVKLLLGDVAEFNKRRQADQSLGANLDLSGVDLSNARLGKADLGRANLTGARLSGADLTDGMLTNAIVEGADLQGANLKGVNMHRIRLKGANLAGADTEKFAGGCRLCLHASNFEGVQWDKQQIEAMLQAINRNPNWNIKYEIVAK